VAERLLAGQVPAVFRIHEAPPPTDAGDLRRLLESFGLLESRGGRGVLSPADLAAALRRAEGRPEERLVNLSVLRAMQQARYDAECKGHFALAFDAYLHFTSPIRRYADLVVHRAVKALLDGGPARERARARAGRLPAVATRISWRERVAMDAEREMDDLKKCAFMARHVGEEHTGTVTGVARHGLYVTLDRWFVDGLVHVSTLPEWVELDEASHALVARAGGRRYALGDRYRVLVEQVDPVKAWINFSIVEKLDGSAAPDAGADGSG
jgi:ribonuclease R